jgi:hypothetical protein
MILALLCVCRTQPTEGGVCKDVPVRICCWWHHEQQSMMCMLYMLCIMCGLFLVAL